ncbi:MAG: nucleotidyltransferase domain-containing protein [Nanoarchaeota archaeon]
MIHNKYYEIMRYFLAGYDKEVYGRELIKKVKISQKNIALTLDKLEKEGILSSKISGNIKYFSLNKKNSLIKSYLLLSEIEKSIEFFNKNPKIQQILGKIGNGEDIICIFGSYAKETQKKSSDLDLFIVGKFDENEIKAISKDYGIGISIKGGTKSNFVSSLKEKNPLMEEILENHIIFSGYEQFIGEVIKQRW